MAVDTKTRVYGESNIVRYLNRLGEQQCKQPSAIAERDADLMDKCTNDLLSHSQPTASYLSALDTFLSTNSDGKITKYLSLGEKAGTADLYVWSVLRQAFAATQSDAHKFANVSSWMKRVEGSDPMVQMLVEA